ncbi:hypothetical protein GPALN_002978 [Globodera pallida]|nr:hypothetical protein GPALN_002978 [Globodera pallida]
MDEESSEFKEQLGNHIKKEVQDGQASNKQQNESNECEKIESDQQKLKIIQKFWDMKDNYREKTGAHSTKEWHQIESKISNGLGVSTYKLYKWIKELGLRKETKSKFSDFEKREILKQFDEIKSKCKKAKLKNSSKHELDEKISKKLGVSKTTITEWKRRFGLSGIPNKDKFSDATKIGILKKYAKIKGKNPKMANTVIADMLNISTESLRNWKKQFQDEIKNL